MRTANFDLLSREVNPYVETLDELYGHYLDATNGFLTNHRLILDAEAASRRILPAGTDLDAEKIFIGVGDPNDPSNVVLHQAMQGEYKQRNALGGRNHVLAAQYLLVLIYEFWETGHRAKVAAFLGLNDKKDLKLPLFGDLRLLRNNIIHQRGIITKKTLSKLEVLNTILNTLPERSEIILTERDVEVLIRAVKAMLDSEVETAGGIDPKHRTIWHVK